MEIKAISIQRMHKDAFMEYSHTFCDKADTVPFIQQNLSDWYTPLKISYEELQRIYYITLKSPLTEERTLLDGQRDGLLTGIKAIANSYLKSANEDLRAAAKTVMLGITGIHYDLNDQYIVQTSQIDNLLNYLMVEHPEAVEKLSLTTQVQQLKELNDRMHEIIEGRVAEREGKMFGAFEFARTQTENCYHDFVKGVNSWAYINYAKLDNEAKPLADFISWANATIEVYKQKVLHVPVGTPEAGDADKDPDDPTTPPTVDQPNGEPDEGDGGQTPPTGGGGETPPAGGGQNPPAGGSGNTGNEDDDDLPPALE